MGTTYTIKNINVKGNRREITGKITMQSTSAFLWLNPGGLRIVDYFEAWGTFPAHTSGSHVTVVYPTSYPFRNPATQHLSGNVHMTFGSTGVITWRAEGTY